jgi:hypothetical protein
MRWCRRHHLMPGSEGEAAAMLDAYLAASRARAAGGSDPVEVAEATPV